MSTASTGIFDSHHPPSRELLDDCVHCGFCLPACPTYALWGEEMDSPRGRLYLMRMGLEGRADFTESYRGHFDACLGCMACVTACPSGVQYGALIESVRPQLERHAPRALADRLFRALIFALFPHPRRLRVLAWPLWAYQRSGVQRLVRRSGLLTLLPLRVQALEALTPRVSIGVEAVAPLMPARGTRRLRVGLLLGCVQRAFFGHVNAATARVLAAEGCEVVAPPSQGCCGALMVHAGQEAQALEAARRTIDVFTAANVDVVVTNAAGCGSTLKEYGRLLADDSEYAARAAALAARARDISEVLADLGPAAPRHPLPLRVAYHDACHLQHGQGITQPPRQVLAAIPNLEVLEIPDGSLCCGSAGIYNLVQPEPAHALGARKARHVLSTGADMVASSNPGCLLQIRAELDRTGHALPMLHMVELVDASIRGVMPFDATAVHTRFGRDRQTAGRTS
jgi:glycolate oxidase iron-sulfur subunit